MTTNEHGPLRRVFDFLASFELAVVTLAFLFLLVVIGTLEQVHTSLFDVQQRYFESAFVIHKVAGIPVPLPGVSLLLVVLGTNLVLGGIVRIRKSGATVGVIIAHLGILSLLTGSAIEAVYSNKGHTTMAEGDTADEFVSYFEWEISIAEPKGDGPVDELVVPGEKWVNLAPGETATFTSPDLPFELVVHDVLKNCEPRVAKDAPTTPDVDGFALAPLPREKEAERDTAGAYVTLRAKTGGEPIQGILWSNELWPMSAVIDGRRFTLELMHRRWKLPFTVRLDDFRQELHPGLAMAKSFESDITKFQNAVPQKVKISMNAPLRNSGYTIFQSGFIEPDKGGGRWWSTFSVVRNPADSVPLWSCVVIGAGLLLHFGAKLVRHVRSQSRRRE